jgi:hypothetical protein
MGFLKRTSLGILGAVVLLTGCTTVYQGESHYQLNSIQYARERAKRHPLPAIYIIYNDTVLGWLYNNGEKFSNEKFMAYVHSLEIAKRCKKVRFIYGINRHGKEVIRHAVCYFT